MRSSRLYARSRTGVAVALTAVVLLVPLASSRAAEASASKKTTVEAAGGPLPYTWEWSPADVTISKGGVVRWNNSTDAVHHVTSWDGAWDVSKHVDTGDSVAIKFKKRGTYRYWCDIAGHADILHIGPQKLCIGMCGTITVE